MTELEKIIERLEKYTRMAGLRDPFRVEDDGDGDVGAMPYVVSGDDGDTVAVLQFDGDDTTAIARAELVATLFNNLPEIIASLRARAQGGGNV